MAFVDKSGYLARRTTKQKNNKRGYGRNWYLVKHKSLLNSCYISIGNINIILPGSLAGKKVRFKMEVIND